MACSGSHCSKHGSKKSSSCGAHRMPRSNDATLGASFVSAFQQGKVINRTYIETLRNKIRTEINARKAHPSYGAANTGALMGTLGLAINQGDKAEAQKHGVVPSQIMDAVGGPGSPGRVPRGGTQINTGGPNESPPYTKEQDIKGAWTAGTTVTKSAEIIASFYTTLIANYQRLYADCICHSDCACNAVCNCHNDCGCNYSDKRLKKEIIYC